MKLSVFLLVALTVVATFAQEDEAGQEMGEFGP